MPSILLLSFVEWAGAFQRPQHLAHGLARRGWSVTYASPGYLHRRGQRVESGIAVPPGLHVVEPPALPGSSRVPALGALNEWIMRRWIRARTPRPWDVVIFNDPRWADLARRIPARLRVFDCMDDLRAAYPDPARADRLEAQALEAADRVWTGTFSLAERLQGRHRSVRFIPCGVDGERFAHPDPALVERLRPLLPAGEGPLAGYFGVLNERFDGERLAALMAGGPWRVVLIGPRTSRTPPLPAGDRLKWISPRPYAELPAFLAAFDLALIPYRTDGPHRFLYPVKALEYLAGGKPVLSTPLPDVVRFLGDYVELADSPEEWKAAGARLAADRAAAGRRALAGQSYTRARRWETMVEEMESELEPTTE